MKKPTLQDVAGLAGVSITTASFVISGKGRISDSVRKQVMEAAEKSGYIKKRYLAAAGRRPSLGILVSIDARWAMVWWFIRPILTEIETFYSVRGYNVVIIPISDSMSDDTIRMKILEQRASAVFSLHYGSESLLSALDAQGIPVVVIMNGHFQEKYHCILADDFQGAYEGARHLISLGHSDILFVEAERIGLPTLATDRFYGFKKAVDEASLTFRQENHVSCDVFNTPGMEARLHSVFSQKDYPTAVFAMDDDAAIRVITFIINMGLRTPEDVSIIAPGELLNYSDPHIFPITTLRINTQLMGKLAAEMMFRLLKGDTHGDDIHVLKVKQHLVNRGSTAPPRTRRNAPVSLEKSEPTETPSP